MTTCSPCPSREPFKIGGSYFGEGGGEMTTSVFVFGQDGVSDACGCLRVSWECFFQRRRWCGGIAGFMLSGRSCAD